MWLVWFSTQQGVNYIASCGLLYYKVTVLRPRYHALFTPFCALTCLPDTDHSYQMPSHAITVAHTHRACVCAHCYCDIILSIYNNN